MSSPASKITSTKSKTASMDSQCTTMSNIIRALDETRERIASMGVDEIKRERVDSVNSPKAIEFPKWLKPIKAFDQKKYLGDLEAGDITLRQIQVATNSIKLPEEHIADYIRVNGSKFSMPPFLCRLMRLMMAQSSLSPSAVPANAPTTLTLSLPSASATLSPTTSKML